MELLTDWRTCWSTTEMATRDRWQDQYGCSTCWCNCYYLLRVAIVVIEIVYLTLICDASSKWGERERENGHEQCVACDSFCSIKLLWSIDIDRHRIGPSTPSFSVKSARTLKCNSANGRRMMHGIHTHKCANTNIIFSVCECVIVVVLASFADHVDLFHADMAAYCKKKNKFWSRSLSHFIMRLDQLIRSGKQLLHAQTVHYNDHYVHWLGFHLTSNSIYSFSFSVQLHIDCTIEIELWFEILLYQ